jgi:asparagine synthase (glutamine-hydrolysing)
MPAALTDSWLRPNQMPEWRRLNEDWGYFPSAAKIMLYSTESLCQQLRIDFPFRDVRLLKLFSGFPAHFLRHEGFDRAPARALLKGRLPDSIRLRPKGMPFSPDYYDRLRAQAPQALDRIPVFRAARVEECTKPRLMWASGRRLTSDDACRTTTSAGSVDGARETKCGSGISDRHARPNAAAS